MQVVCFAALWNKFPSTPKKLAPIFNNFNHKKAKTGIYYFKTLI